MCWAVDVNLRTVLACLSSHPVPCILVGEDDFTLSIAKWSKSVELVQFMIQQQIR